jgi:hypothetical protein
MKTERRNGDETDDSAYDRRAFFEGLLERAIVSKREHEEERMGHKIEDKVAGGEFLTETEGLPATRRDLFF